MGMPIGQGTGGKDIEQLLSETETKMRRAQEAAAAAAKQKAQSSGGAGGAGGSGGCGGGGGEGAGNAAQQPKQVDPAQQNAARQVTAANEANQKSRCNECPAAQPKKAEEPNQAAASESAASEGAKKAASAATQAAQPASKPEEKKPDEGGAKPSAVARAQTASRPDRTLKRGDKGEDVKNLQKQLNARGAKLEEDGKFGPKTQAALNKFQRDNGMKPDGAAGPRTREALGKAPVSGSPKPSGSQQTSGTTPTAETPPGHEGKNNTATFDKVTNAGARNQQVSGKITVNGHTYDFKSGGYARGSLPKGDYNVSNLVNTSQSGMVKDGVGFKANLSDKYDSRVGGTRSALRIHPDGNGPGTAGCIGIQGDRATLQRFKADLAAELKRNGGSFTLHVG